MFSIPVWMTFPVAFNLYWLATSGLQLVILNLFRVERFRRFVGIPEFLPGSKLERLNKKVVAVVEKPTIFSSKPVKAITKETTTNATAAQTHTRKKLSQANKKRR